jgi:large subunit ribosomal protein L21
MQYAVIASGGKQYKVSEGSILALEKIAGEAEDKVLFDKVLLFVDGESIFLGQPYLMTVTVSAKIISQTKGDKIRVSKFKAKARYRRVYGHRQDLTQVKIEKISVKKEVTKDVKSEKSEVKSTSEN